MFGTKRQEYINYNDKEDKISLFYPLYGTVRGHYL